MLTRMCTAQLNHQFLDGISGDSTGLRPEGDFVSYIQLPILKRIAWVSPRAQLFSLLPKRTEKSGYFKSEISDLPHPQIPE